jgi:adenine deaminase
MVSREDLVASSRGDQPLDLAILNARLVNVLTGTVQEVDIGCRGSTIAVVAPQGSLDQEATSTLDVSGRWVTPGFIDGHVHNESSMCTPAAWAATILPRGTTTVCTDPHEIGNVLGKEGIRYLLEASRDLPLRYFITVPSCVPAVPSIETAGAIIDAQDVAEMLEWEGVIAVAEAMDYPGLINQDPRISAIVNAGHAAHVPIEGHAPGLGGRGLQAYLAAVGPRSSDHEASSWEKMLQKVSSGMMIYARISTYGSAAHEVVRAMAEVEDTRMFGACTDDVMPNHLMDHGHMDNVVRGLIAEGVDPVTAFQMATVNVAEHYGFWDLGAVAPGRKADILVLDGLEDVEVRHVIADGRLVVRDGELDVALEEPLPPMTENTVNLPEGLDADSFLPSAPVSEGQAVVHAINIEGLFTRLEQIDVPCRDGRLEIPLADGLVIAAIVPRHGQNTPPSLALVSGYPLERGAIASTVSHDSHNLAVLGRDPADMLLAARTLRDSGGGLTATCDGRVLSTVELPVAGLLSPRPVPEIAKQVRAYEDALPELGLPPAFPTTLLGIALPVIPEVRLTDKGLVDVASQTFIPLFP